MSARRDSREDGFTLIEVVLAMALFTVLVTFTLGMVLKINGTARDNDLRVTAASLVNRQIESIRGLSVTAIPDGLTTSTSKVGNTTFTIRQTSSLVATNSSVSLCKANSGALAYRLVTVTVEWPDMGNIPAPRADTLKVIGTGDLSSGKGTVAIGVTSGAGTPVSDIKVTLAPSGVSVTTGDDGCAVFSQVAVGSYTASVNESGYVGVNNVAAQVTSAFGVSAGQVSRTEILYDTAMSAPIGIESLNGYSALGTYPVYLRSAYVTDSLLPVGCGTSSACITAMPGQVNNLFPTQYSLWAGTCHDAKTSSATVTATLAEGTTPSPVVLPMAKAWVSVLVAGMPAGGRTVTVTHAADAPGTTAPVCSSSISYTMQVDNAAGEGVLLPFGTWTFQASGGPAVNVTLGSSPTNVNLTGT